MRRTIAPWLIALLAATATSTAAQIQEGNPVPDFTLEEAGGQSVSLTDYQGKAVMLFFFGYS